MARKEIVGALDIYSKMKFLYDLDFKNYKTNEVMKDLLLDVELNLENEKLIKLLDDIKISKAKQIFEGAHYNIDVF